MDTSTEAGLSKVTVECTDPSSLFSEVQSILSKRIPLKNLHWKSPSRPARSIESLDIDLVPSQPVADEKRPSNDASPGPVPHRRHQIPGLRQTPYLKVYLLRCDDSEVYKTSSRKLLREWIKTHSATQQASGGTQDNHDAFEWLILHVLPDGDLPGKAANTSKWPGRGSTSVLEKVKADFNGSSKSSVDRVAQLRLPKGGKPQDPQELIDQLNDLVDKIKNAILTSFDLRVRQYEEDIREKDSQRTLPGWNFCTFFILKEGLARGFENVGLLEDALVGYDELAAGLESAVVDFLSGTSDQHGGGFLSFSVERKKIAETALEASTEQPTADKNDDEDVTVTGDDVSLGVNEDYFPLDSTKKPYRDMILANNISIFDFRVYVFSRQLNLLLRAARAPFLQRRGESPHKAENLNLLAEICDRAMEFIILAARTLRYDLECALAESTDSVDKARKSRVVDNFVSSWTYAASCQILSQTATPSLTIPDSSLRRARSSTDASAVAAAVAEARPHVPKRSSSLITSGISSGRPDSLVTLTGPDKLVAPKTGRDDLASGRGELYQLARGILEEIGKRRAWVQKWDDLNLLFDEVTTVSESFEEVSLDSSDGTKQESGQQPFADITAGIDLPALTTAVTSRKRFYLLFEELTDQMFGHYVSAGRTRSAEAAMTEIAVLRYRQEDYKTAATYFKQVAPFYGNSKWLALEGTVLELYARCLKELKQNDEYVRTVLRLLSQYAFHTQSNLSVNQKSLLASSATPVRSNARPYIEELLRASTTLQKEITVPITSLFDDIEVDPEIRHLEDRDGFQLQLRLRFLLDRDIHIDSIKVRLVTASGGLSHEVWLERSEFIVKSSTTKLLMDSSTTLHGKYFVDRIEMRVKNIVFTLGGGRASSFFPPGFRDGDEAEEETRPFVWCYPPPTGLEARLASPRYINLEELRTLEIELESGRNNVSKASLRVRPATAGLRLRIAETEVVDGEVEMTASPESGSIEIVDFDLESAVRFRIPYTVDENHTMLSARVEVAYETDQGRFTYCATSSIVSTLPVSVNVQDVFKEDVLFSRFTVGPAMLIPLRILGCDLPPSNFWDVESSLRGPVAMDVFPKQPASVLYKIRPKQDRPQTPQKRSLQLTVQFTCLDEECLVLVKNRFHEAIERSRFQHLARLLTPHIVEAFRTQLSTSDMEAIGLLREVDMLPYDKVQWGIVLSGVRESLRKEVGAWLLQWQQSNPVLSLPDPDPSLLGRQIVIPVDVPSIQVVHTAELRLGLPQTSVHAAVGHMIPVELVLRHTRRWSSTEAADTPLEFAYEIHANPDLWLVGGRRQGHFQAEEGETKSFAIMLLPQRAGHLLLPAIDIKTFVSGPSINSAQPAPAVPGAASTPTTTNSLTTPPSAAGPPGGNPPASGAGAGAGAGASPLQPQRRQIPNEVDYKNHSETLLVLPDLKKTTVSLGSGNPGLIESERRIEI